MSHELRTPLNAIIGSLDSCLRTGLSRAQRGYLVRAQGSSRALLGIVNDILDFSKMEAGELALENQPFDLHTCVEEALDLLAPQASRKRIELSYQQGVGTPVRVYGDVTRLRQILVNIIANAVKFTDKGEVVVKVSATENEGGRFTVRIEVSDTGIGIPPDRLDRLFRPFSQGDASTTRRFGGTGLGLAIVKRLCDMMGAKIGVESKWSEGTTFWVELQVRAAPSPERPYTRLSQPQLAGKRALIVDDNATNLRILASQMRAWGMTAVEMATPAEAIATVERGASFDVALLDTHMPEMSGVELSRKLRQIVPDPLMMPIVLLSSAVERSCVDGGSIVMAVLSKPVKPSHFYNTLLDILTRATRPHPSAGLGAQPLPPLANRFPLRILLAEDYPINQKVALRMLAGMGYTADAVGSGLEALDALRLRPYDVILMDIQMPEMDGYEATHAIREQWPVEAQPVIIAMTANAMAGDREKCLEAGMDQYLAKPVQTSSLRAALELAAGMLLARRGSPPPDATLDILDTQALDELVGMNSAIGEDLLREVVAEFCVDTPGRFTWMHEALTRSDMSGVERMAHTLKSGAATLGARYLRDRCQDLEKWARARDIVAVEVSLGEVERSFEETRRALEGMMAGRGSPSGTR